MTTDKLIDGWKRWLALETTLPIARRDDEAVKVYPGIYIDGDSVSRFESGGVMDGDVYSVEWETKLVTTPGEDAQVATSKTAHDALRDALSQHIQSTQAEAWMDGQLGVRVFQLLANSPETSEANGYRVTSWKISAVACSI
jgi:hypothetical protein